MSITTRGYQPVPLKHLVSGSEFLTNAEDSAILATHQHTAPTLICVEGSARAVLLAAIRRDRTRFVKTWTAASAAGALPLGALVSALSTWPLGVQAGCGTTLTLMLCGLVWFLQTPRQLVIPGVVAPDVVGDLDTAFRTLTDEQRCRLLRASAAADSTAETLPASLAAAWTEVTTSPAHVPRSEHVR